MTTAVARNRSHSLRLVPGYVRALADLSTRHPQAETFLETYQDDAGVGWASVLFIERDGSSSRAPIVTPLRRTQYVLGATGRAWASPDGVQRGEIAREADYDRA